MTLWYSSDLHFFHDNIIRFCSRPFSCAEEMNNRLIELHNMFVRPEDHWWFLGDLTMWRGNRQEQDTMERLVKRMNGHKRLILGNHDHWPPEVYMRFGFEQIKASHKHDNILFTHIPVHPSSMGTAIGNVHGHIHNSQPNEFKPVLQVRKKDGKKAEEVLVKPYVNISVEVTDYRPLSLDEVKTRIEGASHAG